MDANTNMKGCWIRQLKNQMALVELFKNIMIGFMMANSKMESTMDILDISAKMATIIIKNSNLENL